MTNQENHLQKMAGFVAGTLVHTKEGLRPIEEIKVGDYVLSKPENGGELAYKRVTKTFVRENAEVWGVTYGYALNKAAILVTTAEHPFWVPKLAVKDPNVKFGGMYIPHGKWVTAEEMFITKDNYYKNKAENASYYLSTYDGKDYPVGESAPICTATDKPKRNRVCDFSGHEFGAIWPVSRDSQREAMGRGVDFRVSPPTILTLPPPHTNITGYVDLDKNRRNSNKVSWVVGTTEHFTRGYQPKLCTVYNLEIEDYHTYFVGEHGIWVHNTCADTAYIEISIANQTLTLFDHHNGVKAHYSISTATNGAGCDKNSGCTPLGAHIIRAKIGAGAQPNAVFVGRRLTGETFTPELMAQFPERDWILTRILWLSGTEIGKNRLGSVDSMQRYIYIHGTPDSEPMGVPRSHGCVRMRNADVIALFEQVKVGTRVLIK